MTHSPASSAGMKRWFRRIAITACLVIIFFSSLDALIVHFMRAHIFSDITTLPVADAILVPGASVSGTEASPVLRQRLAAAMDLFHANKARLILVSGDYSSRYYDEAAVMKKYLVDRGIPESFVITDHAGYSTFDSMYRARNVYHMNSVIIVSQAFHLPRAVFIARSLGLDASAYDASRIPLPPAAIFHNEWREPLARMKAVFDLLRGAKSSFTGSGLPIDGSGNVLRN